METYFDILTAIYLTALAIATIILVAVMVKSLIDEYWG